MSSDSNDVAGEDYLAAFLLNRALGWNSRSIGRLMFFCVQRVHQALAVERLDWNAWNLVQRRLPWASPWKAWDRCGRVRLAVVDEFVDGNLDPLAFGTVVDDGGLWKKLVESSPYGQGTALPRSRSSALERWTDAVLARACEADRGGLRLKGGGRSRIDRTANG